MTNIPKVIHYCWFGHNPLPESMEQCLNSWKKYCPDYEIKCWDESNFDVSESLFCYQAYEAKKYAFVTDYARLKIIYEEGGIYLDTDVELIRSLDTLLDNQLFFGAEGIANVATGLGFGAVPKHPVVEENLRIYTNLSFIDAEGQIIAKNCPYYTNQICRKYGIEFPITQIQQTDLMTVYPNEYFNPYDWKNNIVNITTNTFSIHHYAATWMTPQQKQALIINSKLDRIEKKYGHTVRRIFDFCVWSSKKRGGAGLVRTILRKFKG